MCATNRDPIAEVKAGRLREDLYYRLAVIPIETPPLRARGNDIILLAETFLQRFATEEHRPFDNLNEDRRAELLAYDWPGNVRELQNIMRRAAVIEDGPCLNRPLIQPSVTTRPWESDVPKSLSFNRWDNFVSSSVTNSDDCSHLTLDEIERSAIDQAIAFANGSLPVAARNLGISPSTLYRKRERWVAANVHTA